MMTITQRRKFPRIQCEVPITCLVEKSGDNCFAIMRNYSDGGLYFETECLIDEKAPITVTSEKDSGLDPVAAGTWGSRQAEVRWCLEIAGSQPTVYGCGAQYLS